MCHFPTSFLRFKLRYPHVYLGTAILLLTTLTDMLMTIVLAPPIALFLWSFMILGLAITLIGLARVFHLSRIQPTVPAIVDHVSEKD